MSSKNKDCFSSFFQWMLFISISCLISLIKASSATLNRSIENRHLCLALDLKSRNYLCLLPLSIILAVVFTDALYQVRDSLWFLLSWEFLWDMDVWCCQYIFYIYWDDHMVFGLLIWWITAINFLTSSQLCIPTVNLTWSWCITLLIYCWIWFV